MKKTSLTLGIALAITLQLPISTSLGEVTSKSGPFKDDFDKLSIAKAGAKFGAFASAHALLSEKGVPFKPNALLSHNWRRELAPVFSKMPEMQLAFYESNPLKGTYLGDTFYLPEKVQLAADTVIVARKVIFEGNDILIQGNHDFHLFAIDEVAALGISLHNLKDNSVQGLLRDKVTSKNLVTPGPAVLGRGAKLTIDTSAKG